MTEESTGPRRSPAASRPRMLPFTILCNGRQQVDMPGHRNGNGEKTEEIGDAIPAQYSQHPTRNGLEYRLAHQLLLDVPLRPTHRFEIPISLKRATRFASTVLIMRNTAPPRAMMEARRENWSEILDTPPISSRKKSELVTEISASSLEIWVFTWLRREGFSRRRS